MDNSRRLLIMSCTRRKRPEPYIAPALVRYDGPTFRVLRRFLRVNSSDGVDTFVLSAEYGLIAAEESIANYDRRMTARRAVELRPSVNARIHALAAERTYQEVFLCLGQDYQEALDVALIKEVFVDHITSASGSIGRRLALLHDWLYQEAPRHGYLAPTATQSMRTARIRGIELTLSSEQAMQIARERMAHEAEAATYLQSWCVQVGNQRIAPKWLVSQLTGLPVRSFGTEEACRVLGQLGIEVRRV